MALPAATAPFVTLLLLLVVAVFATGCSGTSGGCFAPMIACASPASVTSNATAFRASLSPLLAALPSAAAAAAAGDGYAALRSQAGPGRDRAHALGLCFGGGGASDCHACLWAAVAAASEACGNDDTRRAAVWGDGCLLAYYADGGTRSSTDSLEQTIADLAKALAQPKGKSLWRKAQSAMFFVLAAIVVILCCITGCYLLAETLARTMAAAGPQAGIAAAGQGEGLALYITGTSDQAPVWSVATQLRFY